MAKGLQLALIAEHSGMEWTGITAGKGEGPDAWPGLKPKTPFGESVGYSNNSSSKESVGYQNQSLLSLLHP